jgi:hypothetical protein
MIAYAEIYQVQCLLLLYPHYADLGSKEGVLFESQINGLKDRWLCIGTINLSNLDNIQARIRSLVAKLLSKVELPSQVLTQLATT